MTVNLDACIQCTRCVRACREEQVNDVIGYAFRGHDSKIVFDFDDPMGESTCVACGECVQACPTGALAPAKNAYKVVADKTGRFGVPVLRRRLPAHLPREGQQDRARGRPRRPGEPRAPVREGPLRLRLRAAPAAPHPAAHPQARRAQDRGLHRRSDALERCVPRSDLGRGARPRRFRPEEDSRHERPERARRVRQRQGLQRRGVSLPEAGAHRLRHQQRGPLHAPVPRLVGGRAARRHRLGRGVEPGFRRGRRPK